MSQKMILHKIEKYSAYYKHPSYYLERKLLNAMKRGILSEATESLNAINKIERAKLADSPMRSVKNSLIGSCTLFTRAAIEANVPPEDAFSHSDVHIQEIEHIMNYKALQRYEYVMLEDYIHLILNNRHESYSPIIMKTIEYIHENITEQITLDTLSDHTNRSKTYVCKLFKQEVGMGIMDYINFHKAEESKYFLKFSNMSISDVAFLFNFCNPGYYATVFKKYIGVTPNNFKQQNLSLY